MHDRTQLSADSSKTVLQCFKTVNGKEACTTRKLFHRLWKNSAKSFKTVNGKEACTTTSQQHGTVEPTQSVSKP